jgi:hypothetical protein
LRSQFERQAKRHPARANDGRQPLAAPGSAHGQGRCGYGTMHVADDTGYRRCRGVCVCRVLAGCCCHFGRDLRSVREPPVAITPAGHRGPPRLMPPDRPVLQGRTAARCRPGGNKGNLLYVSWQSGLRTSPPSRDCFREPVRGGVWPLGHPG